MVVPTVINCRIT